MNSSAKMILVLSLIAAISAGLLAGTNVLTSPVIEKNDELRLQQSLAQVIEADDFSSPEEEVDFPLWLARKNGNLVGYVVRLVGKGYSSAGIDMLIGLDTSAIVQGVTILSHSETPGLGDQVKTKAWFLAQFAGKGIDDPIASGTDIDGISGATSSSTAVIGAVRKAVQLVGKYAGLIEETTLDFASIPDGVYTGTARGFGGDLTVEVTFAGGELKEVKIVSHGETPGKYEPAFAQIPKAMVEEQTLAVDTVSGATLSSEGIINAVKNALAEFGGVEDEPIDLAALLPGKYLGTAKGYTGDISVEVTVLDGRIDSITVTGHNDTPDVAEPAFKKLIPQIIEAQDFEVDLVSGATFSSEGLLNAVKNALRSEVILDISRLPEGQYTGEGEGFFDVLQVNFTIKDGKIQDLQVEHNDTPGVADPAFSRLIETISTGQTLDVDAVSGATYSSQGLFAAIRDAVKKGPALDVTALPDGVYQGVGNGLMGEITVQVALKGGVITEIEVLKHNDTDDYAKQAFGLIKIIKERQTLEVDVVSGATGSSQGLLEAIKAALKSAAQ